MFSNCRYKALTIFQKTVTMNGLPVFLTSILRNFITQGTAPMYNRLNRALLPVVLKSSHSQIKHHSSRFFKSEKGGSKSILGAAGFSLGLLGFFEKQPELTPEEKLLMEIKRAILAIQEGELPKAERHLANSWKMSEDQGIEEVKTQVMDIQANVAFQKGEFDRAIRLFQLVTQRLVYHQGVKVTDNTIVEISIKLAQIYAMKGQFDESVAGFKFCVDTQIEKIEKQGESDEDTLMLAAWALQSLAQAYLTSGTKTNITDKEAVSKAAEYAKTAYKYASQAVGPESQQAVAISSDLASILALEGNLDGALKKLEECEKIAAEKHKYLQASIRVNTGSLYLQKGEYSEAERICKEAKMMAGMFRDLESVIRADECIAKSDAMKEATVIKEKERNSTK